MGLNLVRHRHKKTFLVALGPLALRMLAILICIVSRPILAADPSPEILITVKTPHGALIQAELADTSLKRAQGLMFREHLANDRGMLFIFGDAQPWTFWMKRLSISSVAFPSARGKMMAVRNIIQAKAPCTYWN